jgi:ectoine hydroxylase-related dioxygenase (phytanoyl-CoA dioxygenase family)
MAGFFYALYRGKVFELIIFFSTMQKPILLPEEVAHYEQHGYVIPRFRLPQDMVANLQTTLQQLIDANPGVRPEKLVSAHIEGKNDDGVVGSRDFLALAMYPPLVDMVSQVIGNDVALWGCQVFCKPPEEGYETPWHQDGQYWPMRPLATCTVWVALEPSLVSNGCLRVIPGSHKDKILHPHLHEDKVELVLNQAVEDDCFDPNDAVDLELQPGQMSMHDVYMIHGAKANTSHIRRTGVAIRYMPTTSHFDRSLHPAQGKSGLSLNFATRPLWLLKGRDVCGLNDFNIGHRIAK